MEIRTDKSSCERSNSQKLRPDRKPRVLTMVGMKTTRPYIAVPLKKEIKASIIACGEVKAHPTSCVNAMKKPDQ